MTYQATAAKMTQEQIVAALRALDRIADCSPKDRPGTPNYLSKADMILTARLGLREAIT